MSNINANGSEWIGVDLDKTLAEWNGEESQLSPNVGKPIQPMVDRVKSWLTDGKDVRIFTARVAPRKDGISIDEIRTAIEEWCLVNIGKVLPVTCIKDHGLVELCDDKAIQVVPNEGVPVASKKDRSRKLPVNPGQHEFYALYEQYKRENREFAHSPLYEQFVKLGEKAIPFIMAQVNVADDVGWFAIMKDIVGEDMAKGKNGIYEIKTAWLDWGKANGYVKEPASTTSP